jgi:hypothetical protein
MTMSTIWKRSTSLALWILAAGIAACDTPAAAHDVTAPPPATDDVAASAVHPAPDATLAVDAETSLELYDTPAGVLLMESGRAGSGTPILTSHSDLVRDHRFVALFQSLRPDLPVASVIADLEAKATAMEAKGAEAARTSAVNAALVPPKVKGSPILQAANVCNNVCCDYTWLQNNICSSDSINKGYNWFLYDYGFSYSNGNANRYYGAACSAIGNSLLQISITNSSYGGSWSIAPGYYRTYQWWGGTNILGRSTYESLQTSVNSQTSQHLHTYCGYFQ